MRRVCGVTNFLGRPEQCEFQNASQMFLSAIGPDPLQQKQHRRRVQKNRSSAPRGI